MEKEAKASMYVVRPFRQRETSTAKVINGDKCPFLSMLNLNHPFLEHCLFN